MSGSREMVRFALLGPHGLTGTFTRWGKYNAPLVISKAGGMADAYFGQRHWWATPIRAKDIGPLRQAGS